MPVINLVRVSVTLNPRMAYVLGVFLGNLHNTKFLEIANKGNYSKSPPWKVNQSLVGEISQQEANDALSICGAIMKELEKY